MRFVAPVKPKAWDAFYRDESGVGTVQSLFFAIMFLLIGGVAVDGSNLWRHQQYLQQTADAAAHAAVVELALKKSSAEAQQAALDIVEANMPQAMYGNLHEGGYTNVEFLNYDKETDSLTTSGTPNAAKVTLHRNDLSGNPLDTYLLKVANLLTIGPETDLSHWDVSATSIATVAETKQCESTDGIYAKNTVTLSGGNVIGSGYCVHSQEYVWLPQANTFEPGSALSMPDLKDCGNKCNDAANPGTTAASFETNMLLPDYRSRILTVEASFMGTGDTTIRDQFFKGKTLETSKLIHLEDAGISTSDLTTGSIVYMSQAQFEAIPDLPDGLTYNVACSNMGDANQDEAVLQLFFKNAGSDFRNSAIITNCYVKFAKGSKANASVILSNRQTSDATILSSEGATVGGDIMSCSSSARSMVLSLSGMHVAADFVGSNVDIVVDGNIHFASSGASGTYDHKGVSIHSSGEVSISTDHAFDGCAIGPAGLQLGLQVIRHIAAPSI